VNCLNCSSNLIDFDDRLDEFVCGECRTVLVNRIHEEVLPITYKPNVTHVRSGINTLQTEVNMISSYYEFGYEVEDDIIALIREVIERGMPYSERMIAKAILHYVFKCHLVPNNIRKDIRGERDKRTFKKALGVIKHYVDTPWWRTNNPEGHIAKIVSNMFVVSEAVPDDFRDNMINDVKKVIHYMDGVLSFQGYGQTMTNYAMMVWLATSVLLRINLSVNEIAEVFFVSASSIKKRWDTTQHLFNVTSRSILNLTLEEFIEGIRYE